MMTSPSSRLGHVAQSPIAPIAVAAGAIGGCFLLAAADPTTPGGPTPLCPTKALFGFNCPGCGSARMIYSLTHLNFSDAVRYNAVGIVAVVMLLWSWVTWLLTTTTGRRMKKWSDWRWASVTVAVVVVGWFIIRLLPFEPFLSWQV